MKLLQYRDRHILGIPHHINGLTHASTWKLRKCHNSERGSSVANIPIIRNTKAVIMREFVISPMIVQNPKALQVKYFRVV